MDPDGSWKTKNMIQGESSHVLINRDCSRRAWRRVNEEGQRGLKALYSYLPNQKQATLRGKGRFLLQHCCMFILERQDPRFQADLVQSRLEHLTKMLFLSQSSIYLSLLSKCIRSYNKGEVVLTADPRKFMPDRRIDVGVDIFGSPFE